MMMMIVMDRTERIRNNKINITTKQDTETKTKKNTTQKTRINKIQHTPVQAPLGNNGKETWRTENKHKPQNIRTRHKNSCPQNYHCSKQAEQNTSTAPPPMNHQTNFKVLRAPVLKADEASHFFANTAMYRCCFCNPQSSVFLVSVLFPVNEYVLSIRSGNRSTSTILAEMITK